MTEHRSVDISILVVSYNTRELLAACLQSAAAATPADLEAEVLVVDNASADGSADMVEASFPEVRLIRNDRNLGFAAANNQAMRVARGKYVLLLNSDAMLGHNTLGDMVSYMDAHLRVGVLGGQLFNPDGTFQSSFFDFPTWRSELLLATGLARKVLGRTYPSYPQSQSQTPGRVDWVSGALFMVRRDAIDQVGLLDEAYFMYAEEMDWCYRMHQAGWDVAYLPQAQAVHISAASAHRQPERRRAQVYGSKSLFVRKHWGTWQAAMYVNLIRGLSGLKLAIWRARAVVEGGARRETAAGHVASYQFLLARLAEGA